MIFCVNRCFGIKTNFLNYYIFLKKFIKFNFFFNFWRFQLNGVPIGRLHCTYCGCRNYLFCVTEQPQHSITPMLYIKSRHEPSDHRIWWWPWKPQTAQQSPFSVKNESNKENLFLNFGQDGCSFDVYPLVGLTLNSQVLVLTTSIICCHYSAT